MSEKEQEGLQEHMLLLALTYAAAEELSCMLKEEQKGLPEHLLLLALTYAAAEAELYVGGGAGGAARVSAAPGLNL